MPADARDEITARATEQEPRVVHRERLWVSLWLWAGALGIAAILSAEVNMGSPNIPAWLPYPILLSIAALAMFRMGRTPVAVVDGPEGRELHIGDAHLPTRYIDRAAVVPRSAKSVAMGRQLDPAAFVLHRPWVGPMVVVVLDDPEDPTPYWIFSTRHPEAVIDALGLSSNGISSSRTSGEQVADGETATGTNVVREPSSDLSAPSGTESATDDGR